MAQWLSIIAKQHKEWIRIVNTLGEYDYAEDLVQEMYLLLHKYVKDPTRIITNGKANRGYVFLTLRNLVYQFYNSKRKINKVSIDDVYLTYTDNVEQEEAFNKVCLLIDEHVENWHPYDKKLFKLYRDTDMSIRKIAKETNISWVSIFNTLKKCKEDIKLQLGDDYQDYLNEDYERL